MEQIRKMKQNRENKKKSDYDNNEGRRQKIRRRWKGTGRRRGGWTKGGKSFVCVCVYVCVRVSVTEWIFECRYCVCVCVHVYGWDCSWEKKINCSHYFN